MKSIMLVLIILLCALQYKLWMADGSIPTVLKMKQEIAAQQAYNVKLTQRNQALEVEVNELKLAKAALEEHARTDLGMVKPGETFYQIIDGADSRT